MQCMRVGEYKALQFRPLQRHRIHKHICKYWQHVTDSGTHRYTFGTPWVMSSAWKSAAVSHSNAETTQKHAQHQVFKRDVHQDISGKRAMLINSWNDGCQCCLWWLHAVNASCRKNSSHDTTQMASVNKAVQQGWCRLCLQLICLRAVSAAQDTAKVVTSTKSRCT